MPIPRSVVSLKPLGDQDAAEAGGKDIMEEEEEVVVAAALRAHNRPGQPTPVARTLRATPKA